MNTSFFGEMLQTISERGRALIDRARDRRGDAAARSASLVELCEELLSGRGEASGVALAREIFARYDELTTGPRIAFFEALASASASTASGSMPRSMPGRARAPTRRPPNCISPPSRAGRSCSAGSISRPAAPPRSSRCAKT